MRLLVVIVNYRVADLAIDCLRSLATEIALVPGVRVALCDNASGDRSAERLCQAITGNGWSSWCDFTATDRNLGFTGGNNVVLRPALQSGAPPEYVLLLNPDTLVQRGTVTALVDFMDRNPHVGIAGSRVENPDGTAQGSPFRFMTPLSEFESSLNFGPVRRLLSRWVVSPPTPKVACEVDWVSGVSMIIRRGVFQDIGLLDEGYFTYYDDIDFCFNARRAGWPTWFVPASRVTHLGGQSSGVSDKQRGRLPPYVLQARRRYFLKNHSWLYAALADAGQIIGLSLWKLRTVLTGVEDFRPKRLLHDVVRNSVFATGFRVKEVRNPAQP